MHAFKLNVVSEEEKKTFPENTIKFSIRECGFFFNFKYSKPFEFIFSTYYTYSAISFSFHYYLLYKYIIVEMWKLSCAGLIQIFLFFYSIEFNGVFFCFHWVCFCCCWCCAPQLRNCYMKIKSWPKLFPIKNETRPKTHIQILNRFKLNKCTDKERKMLKKKKKRQIKRMILNGFIWLYVNVEFLTKMIFQISWAVT